MSGIGGKGEREERGGPLTHSPLWQTHALRLLVYLSFFFLSFFFSRASGVDGFLRANGLREGDMLIFHRFPGTGKIVLSYRRLAAARQAK